MIINYNQIGAARKTFVKTIAELLNAELKYLGAPTMAYQIGEYTVTGAAIWNSPTTRTARSL